MRRGLLSLLAAGLTLGLFRMKLVPAKILTLEEAIEFINDDELVELTPSDIRVRKRYLTALDRRRHARELGKLDDSEDDDE